MSQTGNRRRHAMPASGPRPRVLGDPWAAMLAAADRLALACRWDRRRAHQTLGFLCLATVVTLLEPQGRSFPFLVATGLVFCFLVVMEARGPSLDRRVVFWTSLALLAAAVVAPTRDSADVWSYAMYGRMVSHYHVDPYRISPQAFSGDPWFWRVSVWWRDTRTVYGPLFTGLSAVGMRIAGNSALLARMYFQFLTAASVGGALTLLYRRTATAGALAFLGLSPLVVINIVNGAHNDALVGFAALVAVLALSSPARSRRALMVAGVALGLAGLIKAIALLPAAAIVLWLWRRDGVRAALSVAAILGGVVAAGYLWMGGTGALGPLQDASRLVDHFSLYSWFGHRVPAAHAGQGPLGGLLIYPVPKSWLTGLPRLLPTLVVGCLAGLMALAGSSDPRPSAGAAASVLAFVLVASYMQPWYVAAMLPLLALQWRSRLAFLGMGFALILMLAETWQSSGGVVRTMFAIPLSTVYPLYHLAALAALVWLAWRELSRRPVHLRSLLGGDLRAD